MYNFCTLFNSNYLSRALAMYYSLEEVCKDYHLYVFAFDENVYKMLEQLNLTHVTVISLKQLEDSELLSVKSIRTVVEYCWTATPATIYYVFKEFNVESCTYIDADIYFYLSPKVIFDEWGDNSILITEHKFSPEYIKEERLNGKYCVQFISFKNDKYGLEALTWWKNQCIIWCYNRVEDGKFGDQKYLDDWTIRFKRVHVLQHLGCGLAGWNISQYEFYKENDIFYGIEKKSGLRFNVVFYHFHYVGEQIGAGKKLKEVLKSMEMVAEGVETSRSAAQLSKKLNVETPITDEVYKILFEDKDPVKATNDLMTRDMKME